MLVTGGVGGPSGYDFVNVTELYSFASSTWETVPDHPVETVTEHAVAYLNGYFYCFGGSAFTGSFQNSWIFAEIYAFDVVNRKWLLVGEMTKSRYVYHNVMVIGNEFIIGGENTLDRALATTETCSMSTGSTPAFECRESAFAPISSPFFFHVNSQFNTCI